MYRDKKLSELQAQFLQTKTKLGSNDPIQIGELTREELLGDMFYTGTLSYFAQLTAFNKIAALQANMQYYLSAGYGTFGYEPKVDSLFGLPVAIQAGGITLDIPANIVISSRNNDSLQKVDFKLQSGLIGSALEHAVPEKIFNIGQKNITSGISAVKGLRIASEQGQRIYQITKENKNEILPKLNLDVFTESEIQQAINTGKEVITHTDLISVPGYVGAGYVIFDPDSGDGLYKIGGGQNGEVFAGFFSTVTVLFILVTLVTAATVAAPLAAPLALLFAGGLWTLLSGLIASTYNQSAPHDEEFNKCYGAGFTTALFLFGVGLFRVEGQTVGASIGAFVGLKSTLSDAAECLGF